MRRPQPPNTPESPEQDDDDEKTVFVLADDDEASPAGPTAEASSAPDPAAGGATDDDDEDEEEATVFGAVSPAESAAAPAPVVVDEDDEDEDEDEATLFAAELDPAPVAAGADEEDEDDGDEATLFAGQLDPAPAADAAPAPAAPVSVADEAKAAAAAAEMAEADSDAPQREKTLALPADGSIPEFEPEKPARRPTQTSMTGVTGGTGNTDSTGASAWGATAGGTGPTQGDAPAGGKPEPGTIIAQYELIRLLGEGGMGAVYLARDIRLGRRAAIKFLHGASPEFIQRFVIEARATARVEHENIVSIYEVGEWGGSPYMVLQYLKGNELSKVIPRKQKMPVPRVVEIMTPVLRALDCAHKEHIVHRDLKPDNIFITETGVTKVLDFGIAKVVQGADATTDGEGKLDAAAIEKMKSGAIGQTNLTQKGLLMGTMSYMSPEQWGNGVAIDQTTDIWAVGVMMFKMLTGRHPLYPLKGHELMVTGFIDEPMPSLRDKAPDLPDGIIAAVDKALQKDKSKRYQTALAFFRDLEPFQPGRYVAGAQKVNVEESPYAGLSAFQEEDASRFFGRSREVAAMSQRLRECPMMAVVGPSGTGKSSFVRAGVVPALKASGEAWEISVIRPGRDPLMALAGLVQQVTQGSGSATSMNIGDEVDQQKRRAERLKTEPGYLGTVLRRHARRTNKRLMIFIDQFEELYTLVEDVEDRLAFTACLSAAADDPTSPMRVVVSMRSDFLDRCVEDVHFMNELSQGLFFMAALNRDGMRESLVHPAEMKGYKFESEAIVSDMLDHLAQTSGALPLLQFTADKLWSERDPARKLLTQASYDALGGVSGALAVHAEQVLAQVPNDQHKLVRALCIRLVTPDRTRAIVSMDELREQLGQPQLVQRLIDQLVAARLLVVQTGGGTGGATVELVHESLIHRWPQLARWLDEGHEDAVFLEQLRNATRQWDSKRRESGLLWRGEMAEEAKRFVRRFQGTLPEAQQHFLKAVIDLSMRAARIRRVLLVAGAVLVSLMLTAAGVALYLINDSRQETELQAVAARQAEERATEAADEAEERKVIAERALAEAKESARLREAAREAERKALAQANLSREQLADALVEAKESEKRARNAAAEAQRQKGLADTRATEALIAKAAATKASERLQVALTEVEQRRKAAERAKELALQRVEELTKGGLVEVLR